MKDLINKALNLAQLKGAEYADIRIVNGKRESIAVKGQVPEAIEINQSQGFGVRVLYKGSWGFSSSCFLDGKNIEKTVKQAMQIAKASLLVQNEKVKLAPAKKIDSDKDGLADETEKILGTDPNNPDTDGDGFKDGTEVLNGFDPLKK